jgi:hypothetical protein
MVLCLAHLRCELIGRQDVASKAVQELRQRCYDALAIWAFYHLQMRPSFTNDGTTV